MTAVRSVGIVGAGFAGRRGRHPARRRRRARSTSSTRRTDVGALGSGITIQGNALRVLARLGVWEQVQQQSYPFEALGLRAPDPRRP